RTLLPCRACRRHVFAAEKRCPFCAIALLTVTGAALAACASPPPPQSKPHDEAALVVTNDDASSGPASDAGAAQDADAAIEDAWSPRPTHVVPIYGNPSIMIIERLFFRSGSDATAKPHDPILDAIADVMK